MSGITDRTSADEILQMFHVSRESSQLLREYAALLEAWQQRINLLGPREMARLWPRHIADGLQLLDHIDERSCCAIDLGSGAGIPGIVLAAAISRPGYHVHLVESNQKKSAFLREAVRRLKLAATVHSTRIEAINLSSLKPFPDLVVARALAPLDVLAGYIRPYVENGAQTLLHKGRDVNSELTLCAKCWNMQIEKLANRISEDGHILKIKDIRRAACEQTSKDE